MNIKTLADILAESDADSASIADAEPKKSAKHSYVDNLKKTGKANERQAYADKDDFITNDSIVEIPSTSLLSSNIKKPSKSKKRKKRFHPAAHFTAEPSDVPAYQPPEAQSIKEMLAEIKSNIHGDADDSVFVIDVDLYTESAKPSFEPTATNDDTAKSDSPLDNLPAALKAYLRTPEQRQADIDAIKAESRLRWLAFYYLSRREYGKAELKQKLLDKEQDPKQIDALLDEFAEKGYQSDYRTTLMLIRENIRKGRGRGRIKQEFYHKKIAMPSNIDELIDMANNESDEFSEFVEDSADTLIDGVDWLKLAVVARTKKYGDDIPIEQKDKARQLRFLQYRGFNTDICFAALNYTLDTLDERF